MYYCITFCQKPHKLYDFLTQILFAIHIKFFINTFVKKSKRCLLTFWIVLLDTFDPPGNLKILKISDSE